MDLHATTDRTVLMEVFTGAQCGPCVNVDLGLEDFMSNYNHDQVAALVYHRSIPGPDKLETQEAINRQDFYLPSGVGASTPNYWVDGTVAAVGGFATRGDGEAWFQGQYDVQSVNASQLTIDVDAQIAPSMYGEVWVNVTALEALDYANLYIHTVVVRKYYGPWNGGNGVVDHYYTVRDMLGTNGADGDAFVIGSGQTKSFYYDFKLHLDGDASDYSDMAVISFVQTHSKTEVTSQVFPRQRYIAPILQSAYADIRTIANVAPYLASGHVETGGRVTEDDPVTFKTFYTDPDDMPDRGPSEVMVHFKNESGQVLQNALSPVPAAAFWKDGRWLSWTTTLDPGVYSYRFTGTDGFDDAYGDTGWNATTFQVFERNKVPHLMDQGYSPVRGDTSTVFRFDVMYRDDDNQEAVSAMIYINAVPYPMETDSTGPWTDWQVYYYETTLSVGYNHKFYFVFNDGYDDRRFPPAMDSPNWFSGPEVEPPNNEPSLTTALFDPNDGTRQDEFTFTIIYTDGEDDRPTLTYIYIDDTPYIMDGSGEDYSAGVTYRYRTTLGLGPHNVHYVFSDGKTEVRYPPVGEIEGPVISNLAPLAVISTPASGTRYTPDDYISFSAIDSEDPEGDDLTYAWTSDIDGPLSPLMLTDKRLSEGEHIITLTVTDEHGDANITTIALTVKPYIPEPYLVDYIKSPEDPTEKDLVRYTVYVGNRGERSATGLLVSFLVDNTYISSQTVTVPQDKTVEVKFTWQSVAGEHDIAFEIPGDTLGFKEYINANTDPRAQPEILNVPDDKGRYPLGEEIYFSAAATDSDGDDMTYLWDFGDGYTSNQERPSHVFEKADTYLVTLTVTDARGGVEEQTFDVVIKKEADPSNGGLGMGLIAGIAIAVLVVIIAIVFIMMRGKGGEPAEAAPAVDEPRPDVPDYLMPDPKPVIRDEPEYPDYSNGIPEEQPSEDKSEDGYLGY
jgi:chitodextrinase